MLNYEYPPLGGGASNATRHLLQQFSGRKDLHVTLVTSSIGRRGVEWLAPNVEIQYLDIRKSRHLHYQSNRELLSYTIAALVDGWVRSRRGSFDLVHAFFGIPCGVIASVLRMPYVVSLRGSDVPGYSDRFRLLDAFVFRRLSRLVWRHSARVVANSSGLRRLARSTCNDCGIAVVPNGVDCERFMPSQEQSTCHKRLKVLFVGRLIPRKQAGLLIHAFDILREKDRVSLTIIGDGPLREHLEAQAQATGCSIDFLGNVVADRMPAVYAAHDVFVLPSQQEGMSNTVLEAMAAGLPVVVGDVGGTAELLDGNGAVLESLTAGHIAAAIEKYRDRPQLIREEGRRSRTIALGFSWSEVAEQYFEIYQNAVKSELGH